MTFSTPLREKKKTFKISVLLWQTEKSLASFSKNVILIKFPLVLLLYSCFCISSNKIAKSLWGINSVVQHGLKVTTCDNVNWVALVWLLLFTPQTLGTRGPVEVTRMKTHLQWYLVDYFEKEESLHVLSAAPTFVAVDDNRRVNLRLCLGIHGKHYPNITRQLNAPTHRMCDWWPQREQSSWLSHCPHLVSLPQPDRGRKTQNERGWKADSSIC